MQTRIGLNGLGRSCKACGHVKVCAVFRAVGPLLSQSWDDETRPFEAERLAEVCGEFVDSRSLDLLREAR